MPPNMTTTTARVLGAVAQGYRYGFDIMDATDLPSGTVYPILSRLDERGLLRSRWEDPESAQSRKRPPRRFYEITEEGREALGATLRQLDALRRQIAEDPDDEAVPVTPRSS